MNIFDALNERAAESPDRVGVVAEDVSIDFKSILAGALSYAEQFRKAGISANDTVALIASRSLKTIEAIYGLLALGAKIVPLDTNEPSERVGSILERLQTKFIVTEDRNLDSLYLTAKVLPLLEMDHVAPSIDLPKLSGTETAFIFFTTGSTGQPKGIELSHEAILSGQQWLHSAFMVGADDRQLFRTTLGVTNLLREIIWPVLAGASIAILPKGMHADVAAHVKAIDDFRVTIIGAVPILIDAIISNRKGAKSLDSLRHVICTSDQFLGEHVRRFQKALPRAEFSNIYGLTEAMYIARHICPSGAHYDKAVPIGRGADLIPLILDEDLKPVSAGEPGRLYVHGKGMMTRYWNNPELTSMRFVSHGGLRLFDTGDVAFADGEGILHLTGRSEFLVKIGGQRADVQDIEHSIRNLDGVGDVVVVPYVIGNGVKRLAAWIVPRTGVRLDEPIVRRAAAAKLPAFMIPTQIHFLPSLPRTHNGKIDRTSLVQRAEAGFNLAPREGLDAFSTVVANVLNASDLDQSKTIVEQGGDSISAFLISVRANELGLSVNPSELLALPLSKIQPKPFAKNQSPGSIGSSRSDIYALADYGWAPSDIERLRAEIRV